MPSLCGVLTLRSNQCDYANIPCHDVAASGARISSA